MNRAILKAFPAVHALIQSSGNRKADTSQYTTNLDFYDIIYNLLIYFYSNRIVLEPSSAGTWETRKGFRWFQVLEVTRHFLFSCSSSKNENKLQTAYLRAKGS